jgi:hypothetical protein
MQEIISDGSENRRAGEGPDALAVGKFASHLGRQAGESSEKRHRAELQQYRREQDRKNEHREKATVSLVRDEWEAENTRRDRGWERTLMVLKNKDREIWPAPKIRNRRTGVALLAQTRNQVTSEEEQNRRAKRSKNSGGWIDTEAQAKRRKSRSGRENQRQQEPAPKKLDRVTTWKRRRTKKSLNQQSKPLDLVKLKREQRTTQNKM